jgi:hypothetical protein
MAGIGGTSGVIELERTGLAIPGSDGSGADTAIGPDGPESRRTEERGPVHRVDRLRGGAGAGRPQEPAPVGSQDTVEFSSKAAALSEITKSAVSQLSP